MVNTLSYRFDNNNRNNSVGYCDKIKNQPWLPGLIAIVPNAYNCA
jgi:hypothetical protein